MASGPDPGGRSRFAKLGMGINEVLIQAYRDILEMEVSPNDVFNKVKASPIFPKLQSEQELLLSDAKSSGYAAFDITLLYKLLRNICSKIPHPTQGWGGDTFPAAGDTSVGDDIERIRFIRNNVFGHSNSASISQKDFEENWSSICDICRRLQAYCGKNYMNGLQHIETQCLEEEHEGAVIEKIRNACEKDKSILDEVKTIKTHIKEIIAALDSEIKGCHRECLRIDIKAKETSKQKDVDTYTKIMKEVLTLMIELFDERSTDEDIYDLLNRFEKYLQGVSCHDKESDFDLLKKIWKKIQSFANINPEMGINVLKRFFDFVVELRTKYGVGSVQCMSGCILLEMTFKEEVGYRKFLDDLKKGIVEQRLKSVFVDSDLLSTVGLTKEEISISVTDIKNEELGTKNSVDSAQRKSGSIPLEMTFKEEVGYRKFLDDRKKGIVDQRLKSVFVDSDLLSTVGLTKEEISISVTDIKNEAEKENEARPSETVVSGDLTKGQTPLKKMEAETADIQLHNERMESEIHQPEKELAPEKGKVGEKPLEAIAEVPMPTASASSVVVAIDFGTTYSGYAFTIPNTREIITPMWNAGCLISVKTPTVLLLDKDQTFVSFGFEAEDKYGEMTEDERKEYYYFHRFKMMLYDKVRKMKLTRNTILTDMKNKEMLAIDVFAHSIRHFKELLKRDLEKRGFEYLMPHDESIKWVLTVPAIWGDPAKQFMQEAAEKAGIPTRYLCICLEPAAAAIYCKWLPIEKGNDDCLDAMKPGRRFIMLDAGGGTIDMAIQEVREDGKLLKIFHIQSSDCGGIYVDAEFQQMLEEILSKPYFEDFRSTFTDFIDLFRNFEIMKRVQHTTTSKIIRMQVPSSFLETADDDINKLTATKGLAESVKWRGNSVFIKLEMYETFFNKIIDKIVVKVKEMLESETAKGTNIIVMVGGFSESHFLQERIKQSFPNCSVVIPPKCGLAVLKGAVMLGHDPEMIDSKLAKYTYGVASNMQFIEGTHPESKKIILNGKVYCKDKFDIHVGKGTLVQYDEWTERLYHPIFEDQTSMMLRVFMCYDDYPQYTDEIGCSLIGHLIVQMPKTSGGTNRRVKVKITFRGTQLIVHANDENSEEITIMHVDIES